MGSPAFKAGDTGDPRMAGSIPVHLRQFVLSVSVGLLLLVAVAPHASAAARLLASVPDDGDSLEFLDRIEFEFDTLLLADDAEVTITKLDGTTVDVREVAVDGTTLTAAGPGEVPSGNYEVGYSVRSSDGALNEGSIRVSIDSPAQALSGGLLVIIGIAVAMTLYMGLVFRVDKRRRKKRPRST